MRMLFADFLPPLILSTPLPGAHRGCWREGLQKQWWGVGGLCAPPWSPGARWDQGMEPVSNVRRGISPPQAGPTPGAQAEKPSHLPSSLSGNGEKTGSDSSLFLLAGGRGKGASLQFPPDQQSLVWGEGVERVLPHYNPPGRWGLLARGPLLQLSDAAQTHALPGAKGMNVHHLDFSPWNMLTLGAAACRPPHFPGPSLLWEAPSHLRLILDHPARGLTRSKDKSKVDSIGFRKSYRIPWLLVPIPSRPFSASPPPPSPLLPYLMSPPVGGTQTVCHGKLQTHRRFYQGWRKFQH